jgi:hypothetical protein
MSGKYSQGVRRLQESLFDVLFSGGLPAIGRRILWLSDLQYAAPSIAQSTGTASSVFSGNHSAKIKRSSTLR